jgi:hypothetical protein
MQKLRWQGVGACSWGYSWDGERARMVPWGLRMAKCKNEDSSLSLQRLLFVVNPLAGGEVDLYVRLSVSLQTAGGTRMRIPG